MACQSRTKWRSSHCSEQRPRPPTRLRPCSNWILVSDCLSILFNAFWHRWNLSERFVHNIYLRSRPRKSTFLSGRTVLGPQISNLDFTAISVFLRIEVCSTLISTPNLLNLPRSILSCCNWNTVSTTFLPTWFYENDMHFNGQRHVFPTMEYVLRRLCIILFLIFSQLASTRSCTTHQPSSKHSVSQEMRSLYLPRVSLELCTFSAFMISILFHQSFHQQDVPSNHSCCHLGR